MVKLVDDFSSRRQVNNAPLEATLRKLKELLGELVNCTIRRDCEVIVAALRYPWGSICSKWALLALWQLTQNDAYICRIFVESRAVISRLMRMACSGCGLVPRNNFQLKAAALRVLTYLSANKEAVKQIFDEVEAGANIVSLLSWERNELVLKEAVGLMVQVTLPFIDYQKKGKAVFQAIPLKQLVQTLTNLTRSACGRELFLLAAATLANISFLEVDAFVANETCAVLVAATKQRPALAGDVALKDQVITILANVSSKFPLEIISSGGLVFLLSALQLRPRSSFSQTAGVVQGGKEGSEEEGEEGDEEGEERGSGGHALAVERIQQKVAAALARLGSNKSCAALLQRLNGLNRLVELCKRPEERNYSDTVLLACLAALRRISASLGKTPFKQLGALDLVSLDLQDAFVLYSHKSESYV